MTSQVAANARPATSTDAALKRSVLAHAAEYEMESDENDAQDTATTCDESGKVMGRKKERRARKQATAANMAADFVNTNRAEVAARVTQQREESRAASAMRKDRDKQALLADRDRKKAAEEKRKAAAQKQERRR